MEKIETNWIVITGTSSSGKTSLINELGKRKFKIEPEVPRILIQTKLDSGLSLDDILKDEQSLEIEITKQEEINQDKRNPNDVIFLDRSSGDRIGYDRYLGMDTTESFRIASKYKFKDVFIFDPLPFEKDGVRLENQEQAMILDKLFEQGYIDLGYSPIRVPVMSIEDRASMILRHCNL